MSWYRYAEDGNSIGERIKHKIRSSPFFIRLFRKYRVPMRALDSNLKFTIHRLDNKFCEAGEEEIIIDDRLANNPHFLGSEFHFIAHEMLHWLRRQMEKNSYFADPEEIESFNTAIAYALFDLQGNPNKAQTVFQRFLPLIQVTIKDDNIAKAFLKDRMKDATNLLGELSI